LILGFNWGMMALTIMIKFQNNALKQLFSELRFSPRVQKLKQLAASEELLAIASPDQVYPFEFICFRITEYRLRTISTEKLIDGEQLIGDLRIFIKSLSRELNLAASEQAEKVYSIDELCERLSVSSKTIQRWRKKGLTGRIFLFEDGRKRFGFSQSVVDSFIKENDGIAAKAKKFKRMTVSEKSRIIKRAEELVSDSLKSRRKVIEIIASEISRSPETVRSVLLEQEKTTPQKRIFKKPSGTISPREGAQIYKLRESGVSIKELMERFNRSRGSIYRIINKRNVRLLKERKIEFVDSDEFGGEGAEEKILTSFHPAISDTGSGLLNREQEVELFRKYNYLKYCACQLRAQIKPVNPLATRIKKIEEYLADAENIKNRIIEANMPLVVSIANKHAGTGANVADLVSEGNLSLMRAVEKFDYTRGYRFSTYGSWAIAKDFARRIPAETSRLDKPTMGDMSNIQKDMRTADLTAIASIEDAHRSLEQLISDNLTEREQYIIRNHFGISASLSRKKATSLKQIGVDLGISKERVRQIELVALQKLRHNLSQEEFDLLTG